MGGCYFSRLNLTVFRSPFLALCSFLYISHSVWRQFFQGEHWLLKHYLNDLLCMPLVLGTAVFLQQNLILRQKTYALTSWQIGWVVAYFSIMFEGIIPLFVNRYTADFFDVICYGLGGWLFWFLGNINGCKLVQRL